MWNSVGIYVLDTEILGKKWEQVGGKFEYYI